jgi:RNA polymerase sigma-70 factor (sigma-E family)
MTTTVGDALKQVPAAAAAPGTAEVAALFHAHYPGMVRVGYLLTGDRALAEELAQEAFVRTWRRWGQVRSHEAAAAYVRATVVNLARMSLRRRMLEIRHRAAMATREVASDEHPASTRIDVRRALLRLPLRKRTCLVLRFYADLSEEETARVLGVAVGTVKSQTHRALKLLECYLGEERSTGEGGAGHERP